ncbi:uncharacterized protein HMPREF1541_05079 [Cyphellophora europaea CBS 101466]|uniref:Major facilitator superfamily (MFS) profile domain-containing protein n=1 Tax=Cyphellophora europaea (strain CBS 101466) TaxID=1220924 RepID=W2RYN6_CYPE1|nr:uncharacterized protein HMPREF1541_05079 [Cyphellophora europaea CBS 101466]ETN40799.1 hypothetical protein HMPREF1541_05079 [Cyphellophora europaea CBS 101466]
MANWSMRISLTLSFTLAWAYLGIGALLALAIPDQPSNGSSGEDEDVLTRARSDSLFPSFHTYIQSLQPVLRSRIGMLTLPIFFVGMFRMAIISVMMQFPRIRFDWTFLQVTELFTATAVMNLVIFLVIVPGCLRWLRSKDITKELGIQVMMVRCSLISTGFGCLLIGISPSTILLCIGTALFTISQITRPPLVAIATLSVPEASREDLYGLIQMIENITLLVAEPIMQQLLSAGLTKSSGWWGIPFVFASGLYAVSVAFSLYL